MNDTKENIAQIKKDAALNWLDYADNNEILKGKMS